MQFNPVDTARHLRLLGRRGLLTPHDTRVADTLLWSCRRQGSAEAMVSYTRLARLAHVARSTTVQTIARLLGLNVLRRRKTRVRVRWGAGIASRQGANVYEIVPPPPPFERQPTEAAGRMGIRKLGKRKQASGALEEALARLGATITSADRPEPSARGPDQ